MLDKKIKCQSLVKVNLLTLIVHSTVFGPLDDYSPSLKWILTIRYFLHGSPYIVGHVEEFV